MRRDLGRARQPRPSLRAALWSVGAVLCAFALLSLTFSFVSWGTTPAPARGAEEAARALRYGVADLAGHFGFGLLMVAASRRWSMALAGGPMAVGLDVDHLGRLEGLPMLDRASHSVAFLLAAFLALGALARYTPLGRWSPPLLAATLAGAAVVSHVALDAFLGDGGVPLWAPVTFRDVPVTRWEGVLLQVAAMVAVGVVGANHP